MNSLEAGLLLDLATSWQEYKLVYYKGALIIIKFVGVPANENTKK